MPSEMLLTVTYFATLLGFGILVVSFTKKFRIPDALFMLLVGLIFGPTLLNVVDVNLMGDIPEFLRTLALIIIVFASSFHLKMSTFKRVSNISLKLAFGGFFFTTFLLAIIARCVFSLSPISAILLGAIVGGTSSSAIVTFRGALREEKNIMDILLVESIFSDPLTVLIPILLLDAFILGTFVSSTVVLSQFWQMIAAGVGTGVLVGLGAGELFKRTARELSPTLSFAVAMIAYALAINIGGSGILAVAICALILGNMKIPYKEIIGEFEDSLSIILTISIFTLLGAQIALDLSYSLLVKEAIFIAALILLVRPIFTGITLAKEKMPLGDKIIIAFTGPRGAACAAMAAIPLTYALKEGLTQFIPEAQIILLTAFLVIIFTMLFSTIVDTVFSRVRAIEKTEKETEGKVIRETFKEQIQQN